MKPDIKSYGLKIFGEDQPEQLFQIGSEVRLECENPMYEIEGNNKITCQLNKTWTPDEFPVCVRKTCEESKYLDGDGTCKDCFEFAERCEIQEEMADDSVLKMDVEDCRDEATFKSLNGTYEVYKMRQPEGANWDEGENVTYACSVSYNTPYACFDLLEATVKNLSLVVNGEVQEEGDNLTTSSGVNDGDVYIYFHLILHYESHHQSNLKCSYQLSDTATLVSQVTKIMQVDELFEVEITPPSTTIKVGESFTLTCHTDSHRALPHIRWSRQLGDGADEDIDCGEITANAEFSCLNSTNTPGSILIVKTIEMEKFVEGQYSYFCQAKSIVHSNQPKAEARVIVLGLTSGAVIGNTFWSIFMVLVLIGTVLN